MTTTPRRREDAKLPVSDGEKLSLALLKVLRESAFFKTVSRDIIADAQLPDNLLPAVIFDEVRARLEWQDQHGRGRWWEVKGVITFDVQGSARSHREREMGFDVATLRNALVHSLLLVLANNARLVTTVEEAGEMEPLTHAIAIATEVDVQHVPVAPPFTRSLVSVNVHYVETMDLRAWRAWSGLLFEAAPEGGATVTTPAWEATTGEEK